MSFTPPPDAAAAAPAVPNRRTDAQPDFDTKSDAFLNWMVAFLTWLGAFRAWAATFIAELSSAVAGVESNKNAAQAAVIAAETAAQNAAGISGAPMWAPGNFQFGDFAWSPTSLLTYRRNVPGVTASAVDPATGPASGWKLSNSAMSMPQQELAGAGPHQLLAGMHYIVLHPFAVLHMPDAAAQEQVRIEDRSGGITVQVWPAAGDTFKGQDVALLLSTRGFDHTFTKTATGGWS